MTARSERSPGLGVVLARPACRKLWGARTVSQSGDVAQFTTVALLVLQLTGSGVGLWGWCSPRSLRYCCLAPVAGPIVDRFPRVRVMITADLARVLMAAW